MKGIIFHAAYASDTLRAAQTAELILSISGNGAIKVQKDMQLREWCLGSMDAEHNTTFIKAVSGWLGVSSFTELIKGFQMLRRQFMSMTQQVWQNHLQI